MPRGLTTAQKTRLAARVVGLAYFVALDLASGFVRVWSGRGNVTALSATWQGVGELGIIEGLEGDRTMKAQQVTLGLVGLPGEAIDAGVIAATRSERYQGRPLTIYLGFTDTNTGALLDDPTIVWDGFADVMTFQLGRSVSVSLTGQHFDSLARRSNGLNMTTLSHNQRLGNPATQDLFFEPQDRLMGVPKALL